MAGALDVSPQHLEPRRPKCQKRRGGESGEAEKTVRLSVICGESSGSPTVRGYGNYLGQN